MPVLTVAAVERYVAQSKRREIRDSQAPCLYLIVEPKPTGTKTWAMRFRRPGPGRKTAKLRLGLVDLSREETADEPTLGGALSLRQARQLANEIDRQRARGLDVIEEHKARRRRERTAAEKRAASTFGAAVREFFADHRVKRWGTRPRRWRGDARLLGLDWPPGCDPATTEPKVMVGGLAATWADKPVAEIDADDVYAVVDEARRLGVPGLTRKNKGASEPRGRKMHSALSVLFRWLLKHRRVSSNPCVGVERPGAPPARARVLSDAEVVALWRACDQIGAPYGALLKLLLLSGQRLNEVAGMRRGELDGAVWTVPAERAKNHRENPLPLPPLALDVVPGAAGAVGEFVFSTSGARPLTGFSRIKDKLDAAMETTTPWRLHDLRRTCATGMHALGVAPHVVEALLNHVSGTRAGVAGVYNHATYEPEKRAALERWAAHVHGIVSGRKAKVVPMRKGGA